MMRGSQSHRKHAVHSLLKWVDQRYNRYLECKIERPDLFTDDVIDNALKRMVEFDIELVHKGTFRKHFEVALDAAKSYTKMILELRSVDNKRYT